MTGSSPWAAVMGEDDDALFDFLEKNFGKHVDRSASIASAHGSAPCAVRPPPALSVPQSLSSCTYACLHVLTFCLVLALVLNQPPSRLLGTHEGELGRIAALLGPDGTVGSQVAAKLAAVQQLEQELRAVEAKRAELEERMHTFSSQSHPHPHTYPPLPLMC